MKKLILMALLFGSPLYAQTARVIQLSPIDSKEAQAKWQALQDAQKQWDALQQRIRKDYTTVPPTDPDASSTVTISACADGTGTGYYFLNGWSEIKPMDCEKNLPDGKNESYSYRRGFENGFEFDKDFKFLVPKQQQGVTISAGSGNGIWCVGATCGCSTPTPASRFMPTTAAPPFYIGDPVWTYTDQSSSNPGLNGPIHVY